MNGGKKMMKIGLEVGNLVATTTTPSSEFGGHFRTLRGGVWPHKPSQLITNGLGFLSM